MQKLEEELLDSLERIKGNGSFVTSHTAPFVFPGLSVEGIGEIAYPIAEFQARALIQKAHKAPFGKGEETIIDNTVRSAWEIDTEKLQFTGQEWDKFLQKALKTIQPELGIEDHEIDAHLYKLLIYEKGDFFLSHKDSEKEEGMFGTLIFALPSKHTGGELRVRFDGEEKSVDFAAAASRNKIPYAAFYADCEHEVKPLTDGYRVCLVYNLVYKKTDKVLQLHPLGEHVSRLASLLKEAMATELFSPGIVLLGHQYTPENFSKAHLKQNDRTRAEALIRAADAAGYYAKMCLVTSYLSGIPAQDGYSWDAEPDEEAEMEEVYDEWLSIEHWMEDGPPPLRSIQIQEEQLLATFQLNEGEPLVKESTGYMGNYGPDLMHWYHYGAVVFWPKKDHLKMLMDQDIPNQLEWIGYYNSIRSQLTAHEIAMCESILFGIVDKNEKTGKANYNVIVDWLIGYEDEACFDKIGYLHLQKYFLKINEDSWLRLIKTYPSSHFKKIFQHVCQEGNVSTVWHLLSLLNLFSDSQEGIELAASEMAALPDYFSAVATVSPEKPLLNANAFKNLLQLEGRLPQVDKWVAQMGRLLTQCQERSYINTVLLPVILRQETTTPLSKVLLSFAKSDLQARVSNKPQPPANWTRQVPNGTKNARLWSLLSAFLQSPEEQVFDFRRNQQEREEMESTIKGVKVDLRTETIKKGSPYTLRIIKTQMGYKKQLKEWEEDLALLNNIP